MLKCEKEKPTHGTSPNLIRETIKNIVLNKHNIMIINFDVNYNSYNEKCSCQTACPNCLQNFWNQSIKANLDRKAGLQLLNWVRKGELAKADQEKETSYMKTLEEIVHLQEEQGHIIKRGNDYWINIGELKKKIKIYPAMCNVNKMDKDKETILIPDRLFKVSIANVWKIIEKHIF